MTISERILAAKESATTTMLMIENHPSMRVKMVRHPHDILRLKSMKPLTAENVKGSLS